MKAHDILQKTHHRPYPLPSRPWVNRQTWHRLLFAHWPVHPEKISPILPSGVELDTYDGKAYLSVVVFRVTGVRMRGLPAVPGTSSMLQINVRTYVRRNSIPGVYFITIDTDNLPSVLGTKVTLGLPYHHARMTWRRRFVETREVVLMDSARQDSTRQDGARVDSVNPHDAGRLQVSYVHTSDGSHLAPGSIHHWLLERYCLYTRHLGQLWRVDIHHHPWLAHEAKADFRQQTLLLGQYPEISPWPALHPPILHYSHQMDALIFLPKRM